MCGQINRSICAITSLERALSQMTCVGKSTVAICAITSLERALSQMPCVGKSNIHFEKLNVDIKLDIHK